MFIWSEDTIRWIEEAASYTGYYDKLAHFITPYLQADFKICEIGCGLGHLACAIAPTVEHITAIDISDKAINKLKELMQKRERTNITPIAADWCTWQPPHKYDVVMLSYFNAVKQNWHELQNLTNRYIIAVLANGESGSNLICNQYHPIYEEENRRENIFNVTAFLKNQHITYELIEQEIEFGQTLKTLEDAFKYVKHYYVGNEKEINTYLEKNLKPLASGYYLPKMKKSGIIIIDLQNQ